MGESVAKGLNDVIGVGKVGSLGLYLEMSIHNNKNKSRMFNKLREKVKKVLQGWKENLFSNSGKEVLTKAFAQAIPIFTIGCFKLPKRV